MRRRAFIIAGAVAVIIVALVVVLMLARKGYKEERPFRTAQVERRSIVVKVTESGEVEPLTLVNIKSELAGEVKQIFVEEGDSVKSGDRLALVQQESSQAQQVAQARASVERAKLDLEDTKRAQDREQDLYDKGFVAKKDVEDAEQAYKRSQIQYELSEKQLWVVLGGGAEPAEPGSLGTKAFDNVIVTSPISGVVIDLNVEQGEMITSGTQAYGGGGTVLMTIADLSQMIVKTDVNEVDVGKIRVGQSAQIGFDAIRGRVFSGSVEKIAPAGTLQGNIVVFPIEVEITGSVTGQFEQQRSGPSAQSPRDIFSQLPEDQRTALRQRIDNLRAQGAGRDEIQDAIRKALAESGAAPAQEGRPETPPGRPPVGKRGRAGLELIKPGMTADLDIIIARADSVLCVPKEAVTSQDGRTTVTVLEGGKPVSRPVIVGLEDDIYAEVKEGLQEGDEVVVSEGRPAQSQPAQSQPAQSRQAQSPSRGGPPR
jgi:HlyD family secretion protein